MRQKMIRRPLVQYVNETGEPPQVDLLVDSDLRLAFTEKSFNALIQKVSDLTGWDLSPEPNDEPIDVDADLIFRGTHLTPVGVDLQAARKAKGL